MISSMTGYATRTCEIAGASLSIELKSVNSRYLDLTYRLHDDLRALPLVTHFELRAQHPYFAASGLIPKAASGNRGRTIAEFLLRRASIALGRPASAKRSSERAAGSNANQFVLPRSRVSTGRTWAAWRFSR